MAGPQLLSLDLRLQMGRRWLKMIPASAANAFSQGIPFPNLIRQRKPMRAYALTPKHGNNSRRWLAGRWMARSFIFT